MNFGDSFVRRRLPRERINLMRLWHRERSKRLWHANHSIASDGRDKVNSEFKKDYDNQSWAQVNKLLAIGLIKERLKMR